MELFDIVVSNGRVMDPQARTDVIANIGISEGKVGAIVPAKQQLKGREVIDATDLVVAPGFIDMHSHEGCHELTMQCMLLDGVTTQIGGNCGMQVVPISDYFNKLSQDGCLINYAAHSGHNSLRERVGAVDNNLPASAKQIEDMKVLAAQDLQSGALGVSFGLEYAPGSSYEEVAALAKIAAEHHTLCAAHTRCYDNSPGELEALNEMISATEQAGNIPFQYSHIKCYDPRVLERISERQSVGHRVYGDIYPYDAFLTYINAPRFDTYEFLQRYNCSFSDIEMTVDVTIDGVKVMSAGERFTKELWDKVKSALAGPKTMESLKSNPFIIGHVLPEAAIKRTLQNPYVCLCSDGEVMKDPAGNLFGHPRVAGSAARFLGKYVRDEGLTDLMTGLYKCSTLAANILGLEEKGRISLGADADITIFNPDKIIDKATYGQGFMTPPEGIEYVIVNGVLAARNGERIPDIMAGKVIRRTWKID